MQLFFIVGASILWIMSILLIYTSTKVGNEKKQSTHLTAIFSFIIGLIAFYIGII
jgi:hypothetical protein